MSEKKRVLVTGGAGFIGANFVQHCLDSGCPVLSLDIKNPPNARHEERFRRVDILDRDLLSSTVADFAPDILVHLAARTDLDESVGLAGYSANTDGTRNVVEAALATPSVRRIMVASSKLVFRSGYHPRGDDDFCPNTLYGESKVVTEQVVREAPWGDKQWCIVRPTSIWGPWFDIPYKGFFQAVMRRHYFHLGNIDPQRFFGYVGNAVHQMAVLLGASEQLFHRQTYYLADYEAVTVRAWAEEIADQLGHRRISTLPEVVVRGLALAGDLLKVLGVRNPPLSSFRLSNMRQDTTGFDLTSLAQLTGPLPFTLADGVAATTAWLQRPGDGR
jgi:GlcNAc-P-P-Und epimerase